MSSKPMSTAIRKRLADDLEQSRAWESAAQIDAAWAALEEAHILSQPWAGPHVRVHVTMLGLAWRLRDRREFVGQLVRLVVAGPGSALGRYPVGNTGRSNVPMTEPMAITPDLAELLGADR